MTTILTKKKDTTGAPAPGDLTNAAGGAELAVNTADKRLYTKDSGGNVVEVGTNPTILNIDNIQIDGSTISSTNTNGNINITPNGTGSVVVSKLQVTGGFQLDGNVTVGDSSADTLTVNSTITSNLIFTDDTYDIGASGATRPRNLYLSSVVNAGAGQFTLLTASNSMYFTAATSGDIAGTIYTVPTIQNWSVGAVGNDFQFYPANVFTGTPTLTLKTNKQVIVGESSTTASAGGSIRLVVNGSGGGGIQMTGSTNAAGAAMVPIAGGGAQIYSYSGAQGSESFTLRGQYDNNGSWALGSAGGAIVSNIGVATYGGLYSDRGATGGAAQTLFTMAASSGSNFGQITNTGTRWALGYGSSVTTATDVLTWNTSNQVGINAGTPNATLEVSASFADSAIEEIARLSRVGGSSLYGSNRAAALAFWDQNNATLTAAVAGVRLSPSGDYNGNIALYYNNTGGANATSVSQLTRAAVFGSYGALFGGATGFNVGAGLAIYASGAYSNLTLQAGDVTAGSLIDFTDVSNTLQYRMGVNHNSIGTGNFAFSYGTGPTGAAWSVLSNGTFGAGNINVTNLSGGGNVRFVSNTDVNASPATISTTQNAALRLRGADNAVLDMGLNSVNTWIQATDKSALNNNYYLHLNPNGGTVTINGGTSTPSLTNGLYLQANSSTTEVFRIQGASSSGLYQSFYNGTIVPLFLGYGGTLSAVATNDDGVIRYNSGYKLYFSADGQYRAYFDTNGRFNMDAGSMSGVNLNTTQGTNIIVAQSWNDGSAHSLGGLQNYTGVILVRQNGLQAIPFYCNGGGGIAYQWTVLNPQTGTWSTGAGPTVNFTDNGSSANTYSLVFSGGGGTVTIQRTGGSAAYSVYVQVFAYG